MQSNAVMQTYTPCPKKEATFFDITSPTVEIFKKNFEEFCSQIG